MARKRAETLTDGELRLMRVLWERGAATVQEVVEGLPGETPLAYNTVLTTLHTEAPSKFLFPRVVNMQSQPGRFPIIG